MIETKKFGLQSFYHKGAQVKTGVQGYKPQNYR